MNIKLVKTVHPVKIGTTNTTSISFHKDDSLHVKRQKLLAIKWMKTPGGFEGVAVADVRTNKTVLIPESNISYIEPYEKELSAKTISKDTGVKYEPPVKTEPEIKAPAKAVEKTETEDKTEPAKKNETPKKASPKKKAFRRK